MGYLDVIEKVYEVYEKCEVKSFPIDCIDILERYKFRIFTYAQLKDVSPELYQLSKSFSNDAFTSQKNRLIAYNERINPYRVRFSLMHELGHYLFEHSANDYFAEDQANEFASNVLAPRPIVKHLYIKDAEELHEKFGLSYAAANSAWSDYIHRWKWMPPFDEDDALVKLVFAPNRRDHVIRKDATISKSKKEPLKGKPRRHPKMEKRIAFMIDNGVDFFERAENYKLYGDDL